MIYKNQQYLIFFLLYFYVTSHECTALSIMQILVLHA